MPTALDPQSSRQILRITMKHIRQHRITTLLVTHDLNIATTLGNKIWIIKQGTLLEKTKHTSEQLFAMLTR